MKRALVTGGSGAIGAAICLELARQGLHVVVHTRRHPETARNIVEEIARAGGSASVTHFDVTDAEAAKRALDAILEDGPVQVLVNNAGVHDDAPMAGMRPEQWQDVIAVSLHGFFN
ncbi:MAG: SDR family NAD(P)-dependent oxidoreductase, partial [Gammaproteobacteria bacterium]